MVLKALNASIKVTRCGVAFMRSGEAGRRVWRDEVTRRSYGPCCENTGGMIDKQREIASGARKSDNDGGRPSTDGYKKWENFESGGDISNTFYEHWYAENPLALSFLGRVNARRAGEHILLAWPLSCKTILVHEVLMWLSPMRSRLTPTYIRWMGYQCQTR